MREGFVEDHRHKRVKDLLMEVNNSSINVPKGVVIIAPPGVGKTTLMQYLCVSLGWIWFSLREYQGVRWLSSSLAQEAAGYSYHSVAENYRTIVDALRHRPRGLMFDESQRVLSQPAKLDFLRDLTDDARVPFVLIGTPDLVRVIHMLPPLESRVCGWITIEPCNLADARLYATQLCEIEIADDLLKTILEVTAGSARGIVIALHRLESLARRRGKRRLSLCDISERFSFTFTTRNRRRATATDAGTNPPAALALKVVS